LFRVLSEPFLYKEILEKGRFLLPDAKKPAAALSAPGKRRLNRYTAV